MSRMREENPGNAIFCMICGARFASRDGQPQAPGAQATRPLRQVPEPTPPFHPERSKDQTTAASPPISHAAKRSSAATLAPVRFASTRCSSRDHSHSRRETAISGGAGAGRRERPSYLTTPAEAPGAAVFPGDHPAPSPAGISSRCKEDMPYSLKDLAGTQGFRGPGTPGLTSSLRPAHDSHMAPVTMPPTSTTRVSDKVVPNATRRTRAAISIARSAGLPAKHPYRGYASRGASGRGSVRAHVGSRRRRYPRRRRSAPQVTVVMPAQTARAGSASGAKSPDDQLRPGGTGWPSLPC